MKRLKKTIHSTAPRPTRLEWLIATSCLAALATSPVQAQDAAAKDAKAKEGDVLNLNQVVVTGTSQRQSKMRSSVSVTPRPASGAPGTRTATRVLVATSKA